MEDRISFRVWGVESHLLQQVDCHQDTRGQEKTHKPRIRKQFDWILVHQRVSLFCVAKSGQILTWRTRSKWKEKMVGISDSIRSCASRREVYNPGTLHIFLLRHSVPCRPCHFFSRYACQSSPAVCTCGQHGLACERHATSRRRCVRATFFTCGSWSMADWMI